MLDVKCSAKGGEVEIVWSESGGRLTLNRSGGRYLVLSSLSAASLISSMALYRRVGRRLVRSSHITSVRLGSGHECALPSRPGILTAFSDRPNDQLAPQAAAWARTKVKTVLTRWSSARYRVRRNCHVYAASASREYRGSSAAPTLQEAFQFRDNFINDRITDLRQFEAGDPPRRRQ